jgi:hypothetical protein
MKSPDRLAVEQAASKLLADTEAAKQRYLADDQANRRFACELQGFIAAMTERGETKAEAAQRVRALLALSRRCR